MRITSLEEYLELDELYDEEERELIHSQFPHVVVIEGDFLEVDVAHRWCWANFGPVHGECNWNEEYPPCPLVLATGYSEPAEYKGFQFTRMRYKEVPHHCHQGNWTKFWLGKTDYDHGFGEFCFLYAADLAAFIAEVPSFDWGEHYPWHKQ